MTWILRVLKTGKCGSILSTFFFTSWHFSDYVMEEFLIKTETKHVEVY